MKRLLTIIAATLMAVSASAAVKGSQVKLTASDVTLDDQNRGTLVITLDTDIETLNPYDFKLTLPEGFTIAKDEEDDYIIAAGVAGSKHTYTVGAHTGYYRIVGANFNVDKYLKTGKNTLLTITVQGPDNWDQASGSCSISEWTIAARDLETEKAVGFKPADYNFTIFKNTQTGITEVTADSLKDCQLFDLNGNRVSKPVPGQVLIAVRNNESTKVLVK